MPKSNNAKAKAEKAVKEFETLKEEFYGAKNAFETEYPEAAEELERINAFKSDIEEHIGKTKLLVREAECTIGEFKFTKKSTSPGYDPEKSLQVLLDMDPEDMAITLKALLDGGVVNALPFDKDAAKVFFPHNSDIADWFEDAYDKGGKPLTPSIRVPKLKW